jgi:hypothetical protein
MPFKKIAGATELTIIKALSFHTIDTVSQPAHPRACRNIFHGYVLLVVRIIAQIKTMDDPHLMYQTIG